MGEKGNLAANPMAALDAVPLDVLKGSPETLNAWLDTYLKSREIKELHTIEEVAGEAAGGAGKEAPAGDAPA